MAQFLQTLPDTEAFLRISRSIFVRKSEISDVKKYQVELHSTEKLRVSRRYFPAVIEEVGA